MRRPLDFFGSRVLPRGWRDLIRQIVTIYENYNFKTQVLAASLRTPNHVIDSADDIRRLADASDDVRRALSALDENDLAVARQSLQGLVDAVSQLNGVVTSLNTTISPLQGATDRLGRLVDRLPQGRRRIIDSPGPY